jgi:hypothetical protein
MHHDGKTFFIIAADAKTLCCRLVVAAGGVKTSDPSPWDAGQEVMVDFIKLGVENPAKVVTICQLS